MSEEPVAPPVPPTAPKASTSKLVLALLVLNLGASGFAVFRLMTPQIAEAHGAVDPEVKDAPKTNEVTGPVKALEPFVVNLDEPGTSRYLKATIQMELADSEVEAAIERSKQLIRDAILSYLSGLHVKDTLGADAKDRIRTEVLAKIEALIGPKKVRRIFFQDFVVQ